MRRRVTFAICALDFILWGAIAMATFLSGADAATAGLDRAAGIAVTILFALTALPAFLLALARRTPNLALGFALGFPAAFALLFGAAVLAVS